MPNKIDVKKVEVRFADGTLTAQLEINFSQTKDAFVWLNNLIGLVEPAEDISEIKSEKCSV